MKTIKQVRAEIVSKIKASQADTLHWQEQLKKLDDLTPLFDQPELPINGMAAVKSPKRFEGMGMSNAIRLTLNEYAREAPRTLAEIREYMVKNGFVPPPQFFSESVNSIISRWVRNDMVQQSENKEGRKTYRAVFDSALVANISFPARNEFSGEEDLQR